ncbi:hypothetical protein EDC21_14210 [Thermohydrogenium kirishiense]|nr:hypothetical protein EDC21_14210 [Thermohydrogenium kirishiense]
MNFEILIKLFGNDALTLTAIVPATSVIQFNKAKILAFLIPAERRLSVFK